MDKENAGKEKAHDFAKGGSGFWRRDVFVARRCPGGTRGDRRKLRRLFKREKCKPFDDEPIEMRPAECRERKHRDQKLKRKQIRARLRGDDKG